jgi:hypothetical protein
MTRMNTGEPGGPANCCQAGRATCPAVAADARLRRLVDLLNQYGTAKFGDEWWPGNAAAWLSPEAAGELATLHEALVEPTARRT